MNTLTIVLTVTATESEEFGAKAAAALAEVAALPEFREGTYDNGHVFATKNGTRVLAQYGVEREPA